MLSQGFVSSKTTISLFRLTAFRGDGLLVLRRFRRFRRFRRACDFCSLIRFVVTKDSVTKKVAAGGRRGRLESRY